MSVTTVLRKKYYVCHSLMWFLNKCFYLILLWHIIFKLYIIFVVIVDKTPTNTINSPVNISDHKNYVTDSKRIHTRCECWYFISKLRFSGQYKTVLYLLYSR